MLANLRRSLAIQALLAGVGRVLFVPASKFYVLRWNMKILSKWLLCLALVVVGSSWLVAQSDTSSPKGKSETRTLSGCLSQGDNSKEFKLTASDGSTWDLTSKTVALADHVGHTVSVTGKVEHPMAHNMKEDAKDAAADAHMKKDNRESGDLKVTDLQMVSTSCQQ